MLFAAATAALVGIHVATLHGVVGEVTYYVAVVLGVAMALTGWVTGRSDPVPAQLITLGLLASLVGDALWDTTGSPDFSVADLLWFSSFFILGAALVVMIRRSGYRMSRDPDALLDLSTAAVIVMLIIWLVWLGPILSDETTPLPARFMMATYPVLGGALIMLVLRMMLYGAVAGKAAALLVGGLSAWLIGDIASLTLDDTDAAKDLLTVPWMLGSLLMGTAAWLLPPGTSAPHRPATDPSRSHVPRRRVLAAVLPLFFPWAILLCSSLMEWEVELFPLAIASGALCFVIGARMVRLVDQQRDVQELYRAAAANSADATVFIGRDRRLLYDSPGLAALLEDQRIGRAGAHTADLWRFVKGGEMELQRMADHVRDQPGTVVELEFELNHPTRSDVWVSMRAVNLLDAPRVRAIVANLHDISDRKRAERELEHFAFHDPLTGLPNRLLFSERLAHANNRRSGNDGSTAVLFLDLDNFKTVNDHLGHEAGDQLLFEVAGRLLDTVRAGDTVARLGGDEFAVLIENSATPALDAHTVAARILDALTSRPVFIGTTALNVSASIGIAVGDIDLDATNLLRDADTAMYHAKAEGRGTAVVYSTEMRGRDEQTSRLHADLPFALDAGQFRIEYQPVTDLTSDTITGFEALLRWDHPELGAISPEVFVPIAERLGSIRHIGAWVLDTACEQLASWHAAFDSDLAMAVNISAKQLTDPALPGAVLDALRLHDVSPDALILEITETAIISDVEQARRMLQPLRDHGVRFAIDDFGTGYSSLRNLQQLPIDILKIDRSFINAITDGPELPDIVRGILDLAHQLHLQTIAEGVETSEQLDLLRSNDCDAAQGYLFSRPLTPRKATALLRQLLNTADGPEAPATAGHL